MKQKKKSKTFSSSVLTLVSTTYVEFKYQRTQIVDNTADPVRSFFQIREVVMNPSLLYLRITAETSV